MVKEGDPLLEIDQRPYTAALEQAVAKKAHDEANLKNDQLNLQRYCLLAGQSWPGSSLRTDIALSGRPMA